MPKTVPPSRPRISRIEVERLMESQGCPYPAIVAIRGYYDKTFQPAGNNRAVYDDALIVISSALGTKPGRFATFNGNTDPSVFRPMVATLRPGLWLYKKGPHPLIGGYPALRQAAPVDVDRDGQTARAGRFYGFFGINVHRGGNWGTGSLGCQTVYPAQWDEFIRLAYKVMDEAQQETVPYLLITEQARREAASG